MTHCTEDDLILHYYGEDRARPDVDTPPGRVRRVLRRLSSRSSRRCSSSWPQRCPSATIRMPLDVWSRIRARLPERRRAVVAGLVRMGRAWRWRPRSPPLSSRRSWPAGSWPRPAPAAAAGRRRRSTRRPASASGWPPSAITWSDRSGCCSIWSMPTAIAWTCRPAGVGRGSHRLEPAVSRRRDQRRRLAGRQRARRSRTQPARRRPRPLDADARASSTRSEPGSTPAALLFKVRVLADELHEREVAPVQPQENDYEHSR